LFCVWVLLDALHRRRIPNASLQATACEIMLITASYALLPPLLAFAIYFLLYHCPAHIQRVHAQLHLHHLRPQAWVICITLITLALGFFIAWLLMPAGALHAESARNAATLYGLRSAIALLAAITLPHAALITWWHQHGRLGVR
jgi:ABC-type arginine/histidine transport system permease subunit